MGGQACVFYGAAEFSRDIDLLILADPENLDRLLSALASLDAEPVAVPPPGLDHLRRGHAIHFRCRREDVRGLRIDVMSNLRGVDPFDALWERRTVIEAAGLQVDVLAIEDLVLAKKTQRDKDWPMIRRLVERHYFTNEGAGAPDRLAFWFRELRTPELLIALASEHRAEAAGAATTRPAAANALLGDLDGTARCLAEEEDEERRRDREYWAPPRLELERLRGAK